jgi:hypothetical protein
VHDVAETHGSQRAQRTVGVAQQGDRITDGVDDRGQVLVLALDRERLDVRCARAPGGRRRGR